MQIKLALPKGRLLHRTKLLLQKADWGMDGYHEKADFYHFKSERFPGLRAKIFHEKDIPIQVAVGNYDLGICSLDWTEELLSKYPSSALVKVKNLGYGSSALYMAASPPCPVSFDRRGQAEDGVIRLVSEYPNLAESFALRNRLSRFSIFPVWGAAEAYPPENADMALLSVKSEDALEGYGLVPISKVLDSSAYLIANRNSWETKDLGEVIASICDELPASESPSPSSGAERISPIREQYPVQKLAEDIIRLALPDGHQQQPTVELLHKAGIEIDDYPSDKGNRRPTIHLNKVVVKAIRPQDMPAQVANGNFDIAITGRDWLAEHLYQFPSSPVKNLLDLGFGKVRVVAVVSQELPIADLSDLRRYAAERAAPFRIASEYVQIADKYARDNRLGRYRIVPTWGTTEAFLPEDADMLIENTQTGRTIARHNLKIIDTMFESTACLVTSASYASSPAKSERIKSFADTLRTALEET